MRFLPTELSSSPVVLNSNPSQPFQQTFNYNINKDF